MHRFFVSEISDSDTIFLSDPDQLHHLKNVLRLKVGDEVVVCDALGEELRCIISRLGPEEARLSIKIRHTPQPLRVSLTVACAVPKKNKMDEIIDKLTQLGVDRIIPMQTARGVVRLNEDGERIRLERWHRLARAAAQQSHRSTVPVISHIAGIGEVISQSTECDLKLILTLSGDRMTLPDVLKRAHASRLAVLIGPEGDFTPGEVEMAGNAGFVAVSLGGYVLRVETAAIAVASYIALSNAE